MSGNAPSPHEVQRRLLSTLRWHPSVDLSRIAVLVDDGGRVVLEGSVPTYADKCSIEETAKLVPGVAEVRNRIEVRVTIGDYRTDATLERVLADLFEFLARMPPERPRATVVDGWVTLEGIVVWPHQRQMIERAVREIAGIRGITNRIRIDRSRSAASATSSSTSEGKSRAR